MKKMLFGLIATVLFCVSLQAQTQTKVTNEENRLAVANIMLKYVTVLKPYYSKGDSFEVFSKKVTDAKSTSEDGLSILKKAFGFIQTNTADKDILSKENGIEIGKAYFDFHKTKTDLTFDAFHFGTTNNLSRSFWASIKHALEVAGQWIEYQYCCNGGGGCCIINP